MAKCIDAEELKGYILKLIENRKKIGQEPTGDDLFAVLGHIEIADGVKPDVARYQGRGKSPEKAYQEMFKTFQFREDMYMTRLDDRDWLVGLDVVPPTPKEAEEWAEYYKKFYR